MTQLKSNQLQIFTMGLQGCGKTTTSICLLELLQAKWLNQDEFAHLNKGAKKEFMAHLSACSEFTTTPSVLIVDRINTTPAHRSDIFAAMKSRGTRIGICWNSSAKECVMRVKQRSYGHKSILPGANVGMIIARTAKECIPISHDETQAYGIDKIIQLSGSITREEVVKTILKELASVSSLSILGIDKITDEDIARAVKVATNRELQISRANQLNISPKESTNEIVEGRYEIHFKSTKRIQKVFNFVKDSNFECKTDFHLTLLYINRALAKALSDGGAQAQPMNEAIKMYKLLKTSSIPVVLEYVAANHRVMAIKCSVVQDTQNPIPYFDVIPHISIAKVPDAQFRECNDLIQQIEILRLNPGAIKPDNVMWLDLNDSEPLDGRIRWAKHGSK